MRRLLLSIAFFTCPLSPFPFPGLSAQKRAIGFDDYIAMKSVGDPALSPDGKWVAYTVTEYSLKDNRGTTRIWLADLGTGRGHEQSGQRPVLVVSDDAFNAGLAGLVMTVPLTSKLGKSKKIPAHIRVDPPEGGVKTPSVILCDQLRTISKDRLGKAPWGMVAAATQADVDKVIRTLLGL